MLAVRLEKGTKLSSAGCITSLSQAMVSPFKRAGVPVFKRATGKPSPRSRVANCTDGRSPKRPAGVRSLPKCMRPPRKVPVVSTTEGAEICRPSSVIMPVIWPFSVLKSPTAPSIICRLSCAANKACIALRYSFRSA